MRRSWRWFGPQDRVSVDDMLQSGVEGVVSALHHVPTGAVWSAEEISRRQAEIARKTDGSPSSLAWEVVESLPVSEDIKKQSGDWRAHVEAYKQSLANLAAAGIEPDAEYPSDGLDIRPAIASNVLPDRQFFWRFMNHGQRAVRSGPWKYLQIAGHEFLFDVAADPMERANLRERELDMFEQLRADWEAWDRTMLPIDPEASTHGFTGRELAEYFGVDS